MADRHKITVHGVTGGQVENSNVAGINYGGMGNDRSDKSFTNYGNMGHAVTGDNHGAVSGNLGSGQGTGSQKKDASSLSSTELLERVRKYECSDETVKTFADERVTGRLFMADDLDELLSDLGITKKLDIRKLKSLKDDLNKGQ